MSTKPESEKSLIAEILDGASQSQETKTNSEAGQTAELPEDQLDVFNPEGEEDFVPEDENPDEVKDSSEAEKKTAESDGKPPEEKPKIEPDSQLKAEIEKLNKRLRDTQSSFHKATQERAALQKELEELKKKKDSADDWFSDEDKEKAEKLETEIKKSDSAHNELNETVKKLEEDQAVALWTAAEAPVKAAHPDYEKVVEALIPALETDAHLKSEWIKSDKSPKSAYELGKKYADRQELYKDPEAYREKMRKELEAEYQTKPKTVSTPKGKAGLDATNSEIVESKPKPPATGSYVGAVFG